MHKTRWLVASFVCIFAVANLALAQNRIGGDKARKILELLIEYHNYGLFNGSALVAEHGKVIYKSGFGEANMEWHIPNAPDTRFRLGSITKQFTSLVIMQLVDAGKIELQAPMSRYLPKYRKDTGKRVTIHHLLTHTSGIPSYTSDPGWWKTDCVTRTNRTSSWQSTAAAILSSIQAQSFDTTTAGILCWVQSPKR